MHRHNTEPDMDAKPQAVQAAQRNRQETGKQSVLSQYRQPKQIHAQAAHNDTNNKSNVPAKNARINL